MRVLFLAITLFAWTANASSTRIVPVDTFKSADMTKTWTPPSASDTLLGRASTDTLTNKSIDGTTNVLTNVSLTTAVSGILPVINGGTGANTQTGALNALLPSQSGQSGKVLSTDGTNTSWITGGGGGGATTALDNLTNPTAINQDLIPGIANSFSLGSGTNTWQTLFIEELFDSNNLFAIDVNDRMLINNTGSQWVLDWSNPAFLQPAVPIIYQGMSNGEIGTSNTTEADLLIDTNGGTAAALATNTNSGSLIMATGSTTGTGNSGEMLLQTGLPSGSGTRGVLSLNSRTINIYGDSVDQGFEQIILGAIGGYVGSDGYTITTANASAGNVSEAMNMQTGDASGAGSSSGGFNWATGGADVNSGSFSVSTGTGLSGGSGSMFFQTGVSGTGVGTGNYSAGTGNASGNGSSGEITMITGSSVDGGSGPVALASGGNTGTGNSGAVTLQTGNTDTGGVGSILLTTGTATSGARGLIQLDGDRTTINGSGVLEFANIGSDPSTPGGPQAGDVYFNNVSNLLRVYNGTTWSDIASGSGANTALSNLTSPTAINHDLIFAEGGPAQIVTGDSTTASLTLGTNSGGVPVDTDSGAIGIVSQSVSGTGNSGAISLLTGGAANGVSGDISLTTSSTSGTGNTGNILLLTTPSGGSGTQGRVDIDTDILHLHGTGLDGTEQIILGNMGGNATEHGFTIWTDMATIGNVSDAIDIRSGDSTLTGSVSGDMNFHTGGGDASSGAISVFTGGAANGPSGLAQLKSGDASGGVSGEVDLLSGNATGFQSGNIVIATGTSNANTTGLISLTTGNGTSTTPSGPIFLGTGSTTTDGVTTGYFQFVTGAATGTGMSGPFIWNTGTTVDGVSGTVTLNSGNTTGSATSGSVTLVSGDATGTGASGGLNLNTGSGIAGTGDVNLFTGATTAADVNSGVINLNTGSVTGVGVSGAISSSTGSSVDNSSGAWTLQSGGTSGNGTSGALTLVTGASSGGGNTGSVLLESGAVNGTAGSSGDVDIQTGQPFDTGGNIGIQTGGGLGTNSNTGGIVFGTGLATGSGASGGISLVIGGVSTGTKGGIVFQDGSEGTSGYVWTSVDGSGTGTWMPATGGGGGNWTVVNGGDTTVAIGAGDQHVRATATLTADRTYTLPACTTNIGERHEIKNTPAQTFNVIVAGAGTDNIDASNIYTLIPGDSLQVICAVSGTWDIE